MAKWCLKFDRALNDDERLNMGCTDEWGTHHMCEGCPHNRYMGDGSPITASIKDEEDWL
jgi:hypothetical protein